MDRALALLEILSSLIGHSDLLFMHSCTAFGPACDTAAFPSAAQRGVSNKRFAEQDKAAQTHKISFLSFLPHPKQTAGGSPPRFCHWSFGSLFLSALYLFEFNIDSLHSPHCTSFPCRNRRNFVYRSGAWRFDCYPQQWHHHALWCCTGYRYLHCQWKYAHRWEKAFFFFSVVI